MGKSELEIKAMQAEASLRQIAFELGISEDKFPDVTNIVVLIKDKIKMWGGDLDPNVNLALDEKKGRELIEKNGGATNFGNTIDEIFKPIIELKIEKAKK